MTFCAGSASAKRTTRDSTATPCLVPTSQFIHDFLCHSPQISSISLEHSSFLSFQTVQITNMMRMSRFRRKCLIGLCLTGSHHWRMEQSEDGARPDIPKARSTAIQRCWTRTHPVRMWSIVSSACENYLQAASLVRPLLWSLSAVQHLFCTANQAKNLYLSKALVIFFRQSLGGNVVEQISETKFDSSLQVKL